jgi:hypothetical protein
MAETLVDASVRTLLTPDRFFDHVVRARFESTDESVCLVSDLAKDVYELDPNTPTRLILCRGAVSTDSLDPRTKWVLAQGIVCKKDKSFVMLSFGGLLSCVDSPDLAKRVAIEDPVSLILVQ